MHLLSWEGLIKCSMRIKSILTEKALLPVMSWFKLKSFHKKMWKSKFKKKRRKKWLIFFFFVPSTLQTDNLLQWRNMEGTAKKTSPICKCCRPSSGAAIGYLATGRLPWKNRLLDVSHREGMALFQSQRRRMHWHVMQMSGNTNTITSEDKKKTRWKR